MKIVNESIFASSLRSFFVSFFAIIGIVTAVLLVTIGLYALYTLAEEETYSSDIKILTDGEGRRKELGSSAPVLLQIDLTGQIGKDSLTANKIEKILLKSREDHLKDGRVKGILLKIDSPGGSVDDSDRIYRLLKEYKQRYNTPIFAFVDGTCASGGYYIACAADKIYSTDTSIIGSVGVLAWPPFVNVADTLEKLGVNALTLYAGKGKDELNPLRKWAPGEQDTYQKLINFYYDKFTEIVGKNRPQISTNTLVDVYGASVFPAPEAKACGFVDGCESTRSTVLKELAQVAGIPETETYQVVSFTSKGWFDKFVSEEAFWKTGRVKHEILFPSLVSEGRANLQYLY